MRPRARGGQSTPRTYSSGPDGAPFVVCCPTPDSPSPLIFRLLPGRGGARCGRGGFAGVEVVPVEDGIEGQEVGALGLPSPEGAEREHHHVAGAERHIHHQGAVGERLAAAQGAGEQHIVGVGRELKHYAGARSGVSAEGAASTATTTGAATARSGSGGSRSAATSAASTAAATRRWRRYRGCGCIARVERRGVDGHGVGCDVLALAAVDGAGCAATTAAAAESAASAGGGIEHGILVEVDRQILAVIAVGDGALEVAENAAQDGTAREEIGGTISGGGAGQVVLRHQSCSGAFGD